MKKTDYNTAEGIQKSLQSYYTFSEMLNERRKAYYNRKEPLYTYYILGRYLLDSCGNLGTASDFIPAERIPDYPLYGVFYEHDFWSIIKKWEKEKIPNVLTKEEIRAEGFSFSKNKRPYPVSISFSIGNQLPPSHVKCPDCDKEWNVETCHKTKIVRYPLKGEINPKYVGKTLKELKENFRKKHIDALYRFHTFIFNKKYIDLTIDKKYDWVKNEKGKLDIKDDYVIEENDEVHYEKFEYYHHDCYLEKVKNKCQVYFENKGEGYVQGNLAGEIACDSYIKLELNLAGIEIVPKKSKGEVPFSYTGVLPGFKFERAWYYWIVEGLVPLELAEKMYANKEGKKSVRVAGNCGCPPPIEWASWINYKGKEVYNIKALDILDKKLRVELEKTNRFKKNPSAFGHPFITSYHIDSWQGLKLFADTMKVKNRIRKISWK